MADRVTAKDVRDVFAVFIECAQSEGFDTSGWFLDGGNRYSAWGIYGGKNAQGGYLAGPFPTFLGGTNREAYGRLQAWVQFTVAKRINRTNGSN